MDSHETAIYRAAGHCCQAAAALSESDSQTPTGDTTDMVVQLRDMAQSLLDLVGPAALGVPTPTQPTPPPPPAQPQRPPTRQPRR